MKETPWPASDRVLETARPIHRLEGLLDDLKAEIADDILPLIERADSLFDVYVDPDRRTEFGRIRNDLETLHERLKELEKAADHPWHELTARVISGLNLMNREEEKTDGDELDSSNGSQTRDDPRRA